MIKKVSNKYVKAKRAGIENALELLGAEQRL